MKIEFTSFDHYTWSNFTLNGLPKREYVVFDLEATGPNHKMDSVTQIGAIRVRNGRPIVDETFVNLVKPWKRISKAIEELIGITNQAVAQAEIFSEVYPRFLEWCGDSVLVTQCGYEFDFALLDTECARSGLPKMRKERLDAKAIFAYLHRDQCANFSTNFLSFYYAVDQSPFQRHDALEDAKLISRIFCAELGEARALGIDSIEVVERISIRRYSLS